MSSPIISVEGLGKSYRIRHQSGGNGSGPRYRRLSEELLSYPRQLLSRLSRLASRFSSTPTPNAPRPTPSTEDFWALKDVSLEVQPGEVVGIIGRNGAGKSTLLKLLSRITEPTAGRIELNGRVASLLEVGTGFHPELTGRENVFLNGAILGMTRAEIKRKFDEIVAFAGVEKFLDTPVKRYSSGMYVRLAFAVAAHLDPEILIVDEVLAVGDAGFQKKCIGKMGEVAESGRTVLFVSHNMASIKNLSQEVVVLDRGGVSMKGSPDDGIVHYLEFLNDSTASCEVENRSRAKGVFPAIKACWIEDSRGSRVEAVDMGDGFTVCIKYAFPDDLDIPMPLSIRFGIDDSNSTRVFSLNNDVVGNSDIGRHRSGVARFFLTNVQLNQGRFYISPSITAAGTQWLDAVEQAFVFDIIVTDVFGSGKTLTPNQGLTYVNGEVSRQELDHSNGHPPLAAE